MEALRRELRTELPGQTVNVSAENNLIFLRGTVKDLNSSARAVQIASTAGKVVNLLYVDVPTRRSADSVEGALRQRRPEPGEAARHQYLQYGRGQHDRHRHDGTVLSAGGYPPERGYASDATVSNALNLFIFRPDLNLGATLEALQTSGLVEVLAEPNVLAENGKEASFLAGGEYPYPVVQGVSGTPPRSGHDSIQGIWRPPQLHPHDHPAQHIRLQVAPEVSSLDFSNGVIISGFSIPGIDIRK